MSSNPWPQQLESPKSFTFQLEDDDLFTLKAIAKFKKVAVSTLLRHLISEYIASETPETQ